MMLPWIAVPLGVYGVFTAIKGSASGWWLIVAAAGLLAVDFLIDLFWARRARGRSEEPLLNRREAQTIDTSLADVSRRRPSGASCASWSPFPAAREKSASATRSGAPGDRTVLSAPGSALSAQRAAISLLSLMKLRLVPLPARSGVHRFASGGVPDHAHAACQCLHMQIYGHHGSKDFRTAAARTRVHGHAPEEGGAARYPDL